MDISTKQKVERLIIELTKTWLNPFDDCGQAVRVLIELIGEDYTVAYYKGFVIKLYLSNACNLSSEDLWKLIKEYHFIDSTYFGYKQIYARK